MHSYYFLKYETDKDRVKEDKLKTEKVFVPEIDSTLGHKREK